VGSQATKRCCECGRRGVKAFRLKRLAIGGFAVELWRCSNTGRCGERGFNVQAAVEEGLQAFERARSLSGNSSDIDSSPQGVDRA